MKKCFITISILFVISVVSFGQTIEELETKLENTNQEKQKIDLLIQLADLYVTRNPAKAIEYAGKAVDIIGWFGDKSKKAMAFNTLGAAYYQTENYIEAAKYYKKELRLIENEAPDKRLIATAFNLATTYNKLNKHREAIKYYEMGLQKIHPENDSVMSVEMCKKLYEQYKMVNDYKNALLYYEKYVNKINKLNRNAIKSLTEVTKSQSDELVRKDDSLWEARKLEQMLSKDTLSKAQKIDTLKMEQSLQNERLQRKHYVNIAAIIIICLAALFSLWIFILYRQKGKKNLELLQQKKEIERKNAKIERQTEALDQSNKQLQKKNRQINDSIVYAKRIQTSLLPSITEIQRYLPETCMFFAPRDIVSGDFYWFEAVENKLVIAAIDCTGHGVPGAFMSMIGNSLMNEIVLHKQVTNANLILNLLHQGILNALRKNEEAGNSDDAMDMALCSIDLKKRKIEFAGAMNPLYVIKDDEIDEIEGDYFSVGQKPLRPGKVINYSAKRLDIAADACYYIFSDGFMDQFGGDENKKFGSSRFKKMLLKIYQKSMKEQELEMQNRFDEWKQDHRQMDDVLVIGFRISDNQT